MTDPIKQLEQLWNHTNQCYSREAEDCDCGLMEAAALLGEVTEERVQDWISAQEKRANMGECTYCKEVHDRRLACPAYAAHLKEKSVNWKPQPPSAGPMPPPSNAEISFTNVFEMPDLREAAREVLAAKVAEYIEKTKWEPQDDDLHRVYCKQAGDAGHFQCGWCDQCGKPRFHCGHLIGNQTDR